MSTSNCPFCGSLTKVYSGSPLNLWFRSYCSSCGYLIIDDSSYSFGDILRISYYIKLLRIKECKLEEPIYIGRNLDFYSDLVQQNQSLAVVDPYGYYLPESY